MLQPITLKGAVIVKWGSMAKFAQILGWSQRKTRDIVSGRQIPNAVEIEKMATALEVDLPEDLKALFFCH